MSVASRIGKTYGRLTVLSIDIDKSNQYKRTYYKCKCSCGNITSVRADNLGSHNNSCGCYRKYVLKLANRTTISNFSVLETVAKRLRLYHIVKPLHSVILARDNHECALCGTTVNLHIHHILKQSEYRSLAAEPCNQITLCSKCHLYEAHPCNTSKINIPLAFILLSIVFNREQQKPTPQILVDKIKTEIMELYNES